MYMYVAIWGFPGGTVVKIACQCRRRRRLGFDTWVGKIPWKRGWQPTTIFLPGESHGQRSLTDYSPRCHRVRHEWACTHSFPQVNGCEIGPSSWKQPRDVSTAASHSSSSPPFQMWWDRPQESKEKGLKEFQWETASHRIQGRCLCTKSLKNVFFFFFCFFPFKVNPFSLKKMCLKWVNLFSIYFPGGTWNK